MAKGKKTSGTIWPTSPIPGIDWDKDQEVRAKEKRRRKPARTHNDTSPVVSAAGTTRITQAEVAASVECPRCGSWTDEYGRCWGCEDWVCRCGKTTGSVLISECHPCTLASDVSRSEAKMIRERWIERIRQATPAGAK